VEKEVNSHSELGWILHEWGVSLRDKGDTDEAEKLLVASIKIAEDTKNWFGLAVGNNSLGTLYRKRGDFQKAIAAYKLALQHVLEHGERFRLAQVYNNLGMSLGDAGEWKKSEEYLAQSLDIKREAGDTRGQATSLSNLVRTYWNLGRQDDALEASEKAAVLFLQVNDPYGAGAVKRDVARLQRSRMDRSSGTYQEAIELFERAGQHAEVNATRAELAGLHRKVGLPWWVWVPIALSGIVLLLFFAIILFGTILN
jgi:tetratricopeptide (TPR) repeat protein